MRHRLTVRGLAVLCAALLATAPAYAEDCLASTSIGQKRWAEAERVLRENLTRSACIGDPTVRYTLAYAVHQQSHSQPTRACEARALYRDALKLLPASQAAIREVAERYQTDAARVCDCQPPDAVLAEGRWLSAMELIDARLQSPECAPSVPALLLARGRVLDRVSGNEPHRACEAQEAYAQARRVTRGPARREAEAGERKMKVLCEVVPPPREACDTPGDEDGDGKADCADPDCAQHALCAPPKTESSPVPTGLAVGAGLATLACGGLYYGVWLAYEDAADAAGRYGAAGAQSETDAALGDYEAAVDRLEVVNGLAVAAGVVALGLAAGAVITWGDTVEVEPRVSANGGGLLIRF